VPGHAVFLGSAVHHSELDQAPDCLSPGREVRLAASPVVDDASVIIKVHAGGVPFARFPHVAVMRKMVPVVQLGVDAHFVAGRFLRPWRDVGRRARFQFFWGENPNWCGRDFAPPVLETFAMVDGQRFAIAILS
jgi:diadenosine tetraphosphatase ApaH/serine/threonine PP2A family protein phosphatase